ncbi:glycosyltransferase family 2 protein [Babjeviella inositovora NRRL Y-12698]|uniref:chitin synthase n=1 Tax=Babjeviella inositovora NRRL Y-12698 TaxID=984486 RepID=A0A1E3QJC1_9ASCO|nr:glycosyltransferase family 2 protein [Babjeviella inositovora NRRL Y-12698]ODQ77087.1 glycosyltransferase family 2 protein [Babjeviella inositovora NRRL Y-12698]
MPDFRCNLTASSSSQAYRSFDHEGNHPYRKKSLVRPERSRIDPNHPNFHYSKKVHDPSSNIKVQASGMDANAGTEFDINQRTANGPRISRTSEGDYESNEIPLRDMHTNPYGNVENLVEDEYIHASGSELKGGTEVYGLNDEIDYSPRKQDLTIWPVYCYIITFWAPGPLLSLFGIKGKEAQFAWREKMGLVSIILCTAAIIAFLTFGFTRTVCQDTTPRVRNNEIDSGFLIINGRTFDLTSSQHPAAAGISNGANVLYPPVNAGGMDASFLFQNVNGNCKGLIVPRDNCTIPFDGEELAWYMPCRLFSQDGTTEANFTTEYYDGYACHTSAFAREAYYGLEVSADVYFSWHDLKNTSRNLVVYSGNVLDLDLIDWIQYTDLEYPPLFDSLRNDPNMKGHDISMLLTNNAERKAARCLTEIIKVGSVDSDTIGCISSKVVLYISLVFILSVIVTKFIVACYFKWLVAPKQGADQVDMKTMNKHQNAIEDWSNNMNSSGPVRPVPVQARAAYKNKEANRKSVFKRGSKLSLGINREFENIYDDSVMNANTKYTTMSTQAAASVGNQKLRNMKSYMEGSRTDLVSLRPNSILNPFDSQTLDLMDDYTVGGLSPDLIHPDIVAQPPAEYEPYGYPLAHTICFVTCYSEDEASMRVTLDSLATTDYPNSHKLLLVVCDGLIKGSGNDKTTPEIALEMMTDLLIPEDRVEAHSYVAVASGAKRHNMAKVYTGFYKYDDTTVPIEKQQRIPMVTIVKCGTPSEATGSKPGNRGKRDSQIIMMSFFQHVMFDERMTRLEFEMFQNIWRITGLMADMYEIVLMVDADTKVFPDSLTHMVAEMVKKPDIMGLCGETKIANKAQSWVTAIQVFEYFISHHQAKAFESVFGSVTCLPGCFCMYRIKAPKGNDGYWVPILANPDIVERYYDNDVSTLHRKNLLLLGEDRFLSSLMLRTFPKRKQVFVPKAACKTIVPDTFSVLLSQRRRWINSTVHNLMELVLVNDLCGTFCFSMQFVIGIELVGTLVLPAAIAFTLYVIVVAIVSKPTPILSLVLLGIIFGLPGVLIVVTASRFSYIGWMVIYILALPIWNFVLPSYSFWKFDDFSWGETRTIVGDDEGGHGDAIGKFDHSKIFMKRWREWERVRKNNEHISMPAATWDPAHS